MTTCAVGIPPPNSRDIENKSDRAQQLQTIMDTHPTYGRGVDLRNETIADVWGVLSNYLTNFPEALINRRLVNAIMNWCVQPSVERDFRRLQGEEDEEMARLEDLDFLATTAPPTRRAIAERVRGYVKEDHELEAGQIAMAQTILRMMPANHLSILAYLCSFFSQVPLFRDSGMTYEEVSRIFAPSLFKGSYTTGRHVMTWLIKRWPRIADGLLGDVDELCANDDVLQELVPRAIRKMLNNAELMYQHHGLPTFCSEDVDELLTTGKLAPGSRKHVRTGYGSDESDEDEEYYQKDEEREWSV